ncbi:RIP metalloprotease RseP [Croceicoccus sp. F390]|uniref:Zinc metalloprotease n=1 Tax=Croceicoccus esteveae TaxID=3075597 RepID=A0ABU2ZMB0_9SPHN|nr:RIP metalloprotease RseP [Croceicoccus sp. F390]MDT0576572.1 RIP metalloprotease RseP [Croceicoccus sp. F390]
MFENANIFTAIIGFALVLGPLVVVHELGHYLVGRWFGVKAEAFSIGFGKELAGFTDRHGTRWKLSALPLGGYVQFAGDMNPASQPTQEWLDLPPQERDRTFQARTLGQRALIVAAGPVTNLLVAILIIAGFTFAYGKVVTEPVIGGFVAGSPAAQAGLQPGDRIIAVEGSSIDGFQELRDKVLPYPGENLDLTVERDGSQFDTQMVIGVHEEEDRFGNRFRMGQIGVFATAGELQPVGPIEALGAGTRETAKIMKLSLVGLWQILSGRRSVDELGGPIKIAKFSGEQLVSGWRAFIGFVALISINLAFINLLPIPVLDGGHLAFYAAEAIRRKPVSARGQEWAFRTGMALVLALMVFVTFIDLASLDLFGS